MPVSLFDCSKGFVEDEDKAAAVFGETVVEAHINPFLELPAVADAAIGQGVAEAHVFHLL